MLIPGGILLDNGEAWNAKERIRLNLEPFVGNIFAAATTASIIACPHKLKGALDFAEFGHNSDFGLDDKILIRISRGLIDRV
jgi:hypothetical protein